MSEYVTVEEADNEAMADLIKQRLAEAGIACVVAVSYTHLTLPTTPYV